MEILAELFLRGLHPPFFFPSHLQPMNFESSYRHLVSATGTGCRQNADLNPGITQPQSCFNKDSTCFVISTK